MKMPTATAMIYKDDDGRWTTSIRGERALLSIMTDNTIHLVDGTTVGRWHWDSWKEACEFVFGPPYRGGRGLKILQHRAAVLRDRWCREESRRLCRSICMIPDCGCPGDPHP